MLLWLKINYPTHINLLRGNHESRVITTCHNFRRECLVKYDAELYTEIMNLFDALPLCCIVDESFFCVHAGISPEMVHYSNLSSLFQNNWWNLIVFMKFLAKELYVILLGVTQQLKILKYGSIIKIDPAPISIRIFKHTNFFKRINLKWLFEGIKSNQKGLSIMSTR